jgi:hypothetical protein
VSSKPPSKTRGGSEPYDYEPVFTRRTCLLALLLGLIVLLFFAFIAVRLLLQYGGQ